MKAAEDSAAGAMESGDHPVGGDDESPSEASSPWGREEVPRGGHQGQTSPDCSEDMEDTDSLVSERLLSPSSGAEEQGVSPRPSWALAFHGEDCFGQEVVNYTLNLGQHAESPCLEQKTQVGDLGEEVGNQIKQNSCESWPNSVLELVQILLLKGT